MFSPRSLITLASVLPAALACLGYEGGLPKATDTKTLKEPMRIKAGQVFDAGWVKYDRGSGACEDGEGVELFTTYQGPVICVLTSRYH